MSMQDPIDIIQSDIITENSERIQQLENMLNLRAPSPLNNQLNSRINEVWRHIETMDSTVQGQIEDLWSSIGELWTAHTNQGNFIEEVNSRLSRQIVELGGKVGGGGGFGGITLPLLGTVGLGALAVGGIALYLVTRR